ncbi:uncharacterized protein LOC123539064 [Mercenaria mercenaria]|uniref:uncharacterized protein LOC123539064 n=1 Tax=Mercenaria mercenaria TaxID=6596 RepID=UPI00234E7CD9|nr:uncharacterized protein LOC123539064 [Mercenaria mercenaria]
MSGQWSKSLFSCFDNFGICVITYFAPCVTFGQTAEAIGMGSCVAYGALMFIPIVNLVMLVKMRGQIREMHRIPGSAVGDCLTTMFCGICSLCQEAQQVQGAGTTPGTQAMVRA